MPSDEDLFASTVPYYEKYRSGYPAHDLNALADLVGLDGTQRVLDIGCGTGQLTIPLARRAGEVVAIDPLPEMLSRGLAAATAARAPNITWLRGDSSQLAELVSPGALLAVFAASFHWTDRRAVAEALDDLLVPNGSIVVINDDLGDAEQPSWDDAIANVRDRYLPSGRATNPSLRPSHRKVLAKSPFSVVQALTWSWSRELTIEEVVGLQFSYSFSSPAILGERAENFGRDVREAVRATNPSGVVTEPFRVEVLVAQRP